MAKVKTEWIVATIIGWVFVLLGVLIAVVGVKTEDTPLIICGAIMGNGSALLTFYAMNRLTRGNDDKG